MTQNIRDLVLATAPALFVCFGCNGAVERDDRHLWTVSGPPAEEQEPSAAPSSSWAGRATPQLGRGTLVPLYSATGAPSHSADPSARESICVSVGADGNIDSIDELSCTLAMDMHECAPNDCPWIRCGDCLIHVDRSSHYLEDATGRSGPPWLLRGSKACAAFDGFYEVYADATCGERSAE